MNPLTRLRLSLHKRTLPKLDDQFQQLSFGAHALQKMLRNYEFDSVLDIGCGAGTHADILLKHGKHVTAIDYGKSSYFERMKQQKGIKTIIGDINNHSFDELFDGVWASHVLEHQLTPHLFLKRLHGLLREGGVLAVTVPPLKHEIVGGHLSLWNGGLLLYHLVMAGFNCKKACVLRYGYNISVIIEKDSITIPGLSYDNGDIRKLLEFLPPGLNEPFNGDIWRLNW